MQTERDKALLRATPAQVSPTPNPINFNEQFVTYHMPTPKQAPNAPQVSQDVTIPDEMRDDVPMKDQAPVRRSVRLQQQTSYGPAAISQEEALYHVCGLGYTNAPLYTVPTALEN